MFSLKTSLPPNMHSFTVLFDLLDLTSQGMLVLAQGAQAPAADAPQPPAGGLAELISGFFQNPINILMLAAMSFFLIVLLPQQRQMKAQQKALEKALAALKKNDRVVTASGIHGTVIQTNAEDAVVIIRIDENSGARMTINRDVIAKVITSDK